MKQIFYSWLCLGILIACKSNESSGRQPFNAEDQASELEWLHEWIDAWEFMVKEVLKLPQEKAPLMLFYDDTYVYTTSDISAPQGQSFEGPAYFSEKLPWEKQTHNDTLTLPDAQKVPVQLMTFAAPSEKQGVESFFVMAAPSFWKNAGIDSEEVGLEKMLRGVFLHEFAHTRQMNGIGRIITEYERNYSFDYEVSDDLIQDYFADDSAYVKKFREEVEVFYSAVLTEDEAVMRNLAQQGMRMLKERQEKYLSEEHQRLAAVDNVFLTMEGIGQYMIVSYLQSPKGGNISKDTAIKVARRGKSWWSQDEGLALVLLYERLNPNPDWKILFRENPADIVTLIETALK